jgi:hypothetical protein
MRFEFELEMVVDLIKDLDQQIVRSQFPFKFELLPWML